MIRISVSTLVAGILLFSSLAFAEPIPYEIANQSSVSMGKISYRIILNKPGNSLPNESELSEISSFIASRHKTLNRVFVHFYLPGMNTNQVAYATAHHPNMTVVIQDYALQLNPPE